MFKSVKKSILLNAANSTASRQFYVITGRVPVILVQRVTNLVNKFALVFKRSMFRQNSRDRLCVTPENDDIKWGEVLKSAVIFSVFMLFSAAAQAKVCFLPDSNCGGVNYGYTDKSGSTCTYKTRDEANRKKGECETVQKQGFCFYLSCSMSKSDCDKAAANDPNHDKCCVPCGNCWKVDDCSIPPIETCTGAGYETEQTCKNKNQNFKPNGKFDKNGTACGECKDVPYITCPEMGDDYVTRAECTAKGSSFTFASADVKDSDGNECGTCDKVESETCYEKGYKKYCDYTEDTHLLDVYGSDGQCVRCSFCASSINAIRAYYAKNYAKNYVYYPIMIINRMVSNYVNNVKCKVSAGSVKGVYQGKTYFFRIYDENGKEIQQSNAIYINGVPNASCWNNNFGYTAYFHEPDKDYCKKYTMKIFSMMPDLDIEMVKIIAHNVNYYEGASKNYICQTSDYTTVMDEDGHYPYNGIDYYDLDEFERYVYTENGGEKIPSTRYLNGYSSYPNKAYVISKAFKKSTVNFSDIETSDYSQCWRGSDLSNQSFTVVEIPFTMRKGEIYGLDVVFKLNGTTACVENERVTFSYQNGNDIATKTITTEEPRVYTPEIDGFETTQGTPTLYPTLGYDEACSL